MTTLFPNFNIYSTPLLVLVIQGLIFAFLLLNRFRQKKYIPDLLLGTILLVTCWHRTTYTIGFMGWYDTFRETKINYFLLSFSLALAPLLYLYVRSVTVSGFRFVRQHLYHFIPFILFFVYRVFLYLYDLNQPGFAETQNGILMEKLNNNFLEAIISGLENISMILYLAFTFQSYYNYKNKLTQYYSNTYNLELSWLRNFLFIYAFLYIYSVIQLVVNIYVSDLHWTQKWWYHFFSGLAIIYIGIKGYFTNTNVLQDLEFNTIRQSIIDGVKPNKKNYSQEIELIDTYFRKNKPYLNPDLNLKILAKQLSYSTNQTSEVINSGYGLNFNDFVNGYRVETVKEALRSGKQKKMSLVGIAMDAGFNSKPTFNRVFKKLTGLSPTQYLEKLHN